MRRTFLAYIAAALAAAVIPALRANAQQSAPAATQSAQATQPASAVAQSAPAIELGRRYTDLQHGVSLCPPADTTAEKIISPVQLISWVKKPAGTQAIQWTLAVQHVSEPGVVIDLKAYAAAAQAKYPDYKAPEGGHAGQVAIIKVGQKGAFEIFGTAGNAKLKLWQKQVWVQTSPTDFLILVISGPPDGKAMLEALAPRTVASAGVAG